MRNMYNTGVDEPRAANVWADSKGNGRDARSGGRRGKLLLLTDGLPPGDLSGLYYLWIWGAARQLRRGRSGWRCVVDLAEQLNVATRGG